MTRRRSIFLVVLIAGTVFRAFGQTGPCLHRAIPVQVYSDGSGAVTGLTAASFALSVRGKRVAVANASFDRGPRRVVILIDVSGSVTGTGKLRFGLLFVRNLISAAPPQDSLALMTFSSRVDDVLPFGSSRAALLGETYKLETTHWGRLKGRSTALNGSLMNALTLLPSPRLGDSVCVVTDGVDNASHAPRRVVKAAIESAGVRVFSFLVMAAPTRGSANEGEGASAMRDFAETTGGDCMMFAPEQLSLFETPDLHPLKATKQDLVDLESVAQRFSREISFFIELDLKLPMPLAKPADLKLDLVGSSGRRLRRLRAIYPQRLAACAP